MKRRNLLKCMLAALFVGAALTMAAEPPAPTPIKANPKSKIYHKSTCRFYAAKGNTKSFATEAEAKAAGYKPCKKCCGAKKAAPKKEPETKKPAAKKVAPAPAKPGPAEKTKE